MSGDMKRGHTSAAVAAAMTPAHLKLLGEHLHALGPLDSGERLEGNAGQ
jgi:hypothetical protein